MNTTKAEGTQDTSGWGLLGLVVGVVTGLLVSFYMIVPNFPKDRSTMGITLLTAIVTGAMTIGGVAGYLLARRKVASRIG